MTARRIAALSVVGAALTFVAFGVVRGALPAGPARGTRLTVAIEPPVDDAARTMAAHVVRDRLEERGTDVRVVPAGDTLVVEVGVEDRELVAMQREILERIGKLEVRRVDASSSWLAKVATHTAADAASGIRVEQGVPIVADRREDLPVAEADTIGCTGRVEDGKRHCVTRGDRILAAYITSLAARPELAIPDDRVVAYGRVADGHAWRPYLLERAAILDGAGIRQADVFRGGAAITVADARALTGLVVGTAVAFVFDGTVYFVGAPDRVAGTQLHVPTTGDDAARAAIDLVSVVEAGAVRPLHVVRQETFSRATGFLPRAWPFFVIGAVLLVVAALLWRR